jgi:hypothetical protein
MPSWRNTLWLLFSLWSKHRRPNVGRMPDMPFVLITVQSVCKKLPSLQRNKELCGVTWIPTRTGILGDAYTVVISLLSVRISGGSFTRLTVVQTSRYHLRRCALVFTKTNICNQEETGVRHPQHTQTGSNSSTIAADSSNGVTNTRRCRYSCMRSWLWVEVPPETCRTVSRYK